MDILWNESKKIKITPALPTSANDDFTGNDGDAPNPLLWQAPVLTGTGGYCSIYTNSLKSGVTSSIDGEAATYSAFKITGDFDIQVDFSTPSVDSYSYRWGVALYCVFDDGKFAYSGRHCATDGPYRQEMTGLVEWHGGTIAASGKFRITRAGSFVTLFYWDGTSWVSNKSGSLTTADVTIKLQTRTWAYVSSIECYFDNFIINSGTIVWPELTNFQLPIHIKGITLGASLDPHWDSVVLALPFDGENNSTTFTDISSTPKTITRYGDTKVSNVQSKFGGASAYFDGTGDYLATPDSDDFYFGNGDFTLECWVRPDTTTYIPIFSQIGNITQDTNRLMFGYWSGAWNLYNNTTITVVNVISPADAVTVGVWIHIAFVREGTTFTIFKNGTVIHTASSSATLTNNSSVAYIGTNRVGSLQRYLNGYIDDLRITKGVARYTENFTPPIYSISTTTPDVLVGSGITGYDASAVFDDIGSNNKKIALEIGDTKAECLLQIPPDSWDAAAKDAMILATIPSLTSDTILNFYYDSTHEDNPNVIDVDPLPDAPTDPYELSVYSLALADDFWTFASVLWSFKSVRSALWLYDPDTYCARDVSGLISKWVDGSGYGRNLGQSSSSHYPLLVNEGVQFDGDKELHLYPAEIGRNTSGISMFVVAKTTSEEMQSLLYGSLGLSKGLFSITLNETLGSASCVGRSKSADPLQSVGIGSFAQNQLSIFYAYFDFTGSSFGGSVNGGDIVSSVFQGDTNNSDSLRGISIGGSIESQQSLIGNITEVMIVDSVLDAATVRKVERYLANRHGLLTLLPEAHPYKTVEPELEPLLDPPEIIPVNIDPFPLLLDNMILHDPVDGYNPTHRHFLGGVVTVNGAPARKRIVLSNRGTADRIAVTRSDPATGEWQLSHLPEYPERSLTVMAFDDSGEFNAEIFDHVTQVVK